MTIIDIMHKDNSYRALLTEQYADVTALFKYIVDMFATEHDTFKKINLLDISVGEKGKEETVDMGFTTITTKQNGKTLGLNFKSALENKLLPSVVFPENFVEGLEFAGIRFDHVDCENRVEVLFYFGGYDEDKEVTRPAIIMVSLDEEDGPAEDGDLFFIIGYIQYILSEAEVAMSVKEYAESNLQRDQGNNDIKKNTE